MAPAVDPSQLLKGVLPLATLAVVESADAYGYEVRHQLRAGGLDSVGDASVYGTLQRLYDGGLLSSYVVPSDSGPSRQYYAITPSGRLALSRGSRALEVLPDGRGRVARRRLPDDRVSSTTTCARSRPPVPTCRRTSAVVSSRTSLRTCTRSTRRRATSTPSSARREQYARELREALDLRRRPSRLHGVRPAAPGRRCRRPQSRRGPSRHRPRDRRRRALPDLRARAAALIPTRVDRDGQSVLADRRATSLRTDSMTSRKSTRSRHIAIRSGSGIAVVRAGRPGQYEGRAAGDRPRQFAVAAGQPLPRDATRRSPPPSCSRTRRRDGPTPRAARAAARRGRTRQAARACAAGSRRGRSARSPNAGSRASSAEPSSIGVRPLWCSSTQNEFPAPA